MENEFMTQVILPALYAILAAIIPILAGFAIDAVRKWSEKQKAEWLRLVLDEAATAAERAVMMVDQTYAKEARDHKGHLAPDRAEAAFQKALRAARLQLGADGLDALSRLLGGAERVDAVLGDYVESAVGRTKVPALPVRPTGDEFLTGG